MRVSKPFKTKAKLATLALGSKLLEGSWTIGTAIVGTKVYDDHIKTKKVDEIVFSPSKPSTKAYDPSSPVPVIPPSVVVKPEPQLTPDILLAFFVSGIIGILTLLFVKYSFNKKR